MTVEKRNKSNRQYHYRARRGPSGVVKEYVGPADDPVVQIMLRHDRLGQAERKAAREAAKAELNRYKTAESLVLDLQSKFGLICQAILLDAGYHWHRREGWTKKVRKQRMPVQPPCSFPSGCYP